MSNYNMTESLSLIMPEIFIAVIAMALLLVGAFRGNKATPGIIMGTMITIIVALYMLTVASIEPAAGFFDMVVSNSFTVFVKMLILLSALLVCMMTVPWLMRREASSFEFPILMLFSVLGMMLMVCANDMLSLYMGLELSSLALYILASFARDDLRSSEAGIKYFILGAIASGMILFGASMIYGFAGSTNFAVLSEYFASVDVQNQAHIGVVVGLVFVIVGFCFKVSAVPFHMWTPDVYEGAPTPVTAFFATAPKVAAMAVFIRVLMEPFALWVDAWQQVVIVASVASMIIGALGAIMQKNIKRLLAYSSIGHMGFVLVGVAAGTQEGIQGVMIYLTLYIFMSAGAFGCILLMKRGGVYIEEISELAGLSRTHPVLAFLFALFMFSMAGIPPLAGFFGKMYVFLAAVNAGLYALAVIGVLASVVAAFYYIKIVKIMYFEASKSSFDGDIDHSIRYVLGVSALVTLFFVVAPSLLIQVAELAAKAVVS